MPLLPFCPFRSAMLPVWSIRFRSFYRREERRLPATLVYLRRRDCSFPCGLSGYSVCLTDVSEKNSEEMPDPRHIEIFVYVAAAPASLQQIMAICGNVVFVGWLEKQLTVMPLSARIWNKYYTVCTWYRSISPSIRKLLASSWLTAKTTIVRPQASHANVCLHPATATAHFDARTTHRRRAQKSNNFIFNTHTLRNCATIFDDKFK